MLNTASRMRVACRSLSTAPQNRVSEITRLGGAKRNPTCVFGGLRRKKPRLTHPTVTTVTGCIMDTLLCWSVLSEDPGSVSRLNPGDGWFSGFTMGTIACTLNRFHWGKKIGPFREKALSEITSGGAPPLVSCCH
jgi:hypothetical protein